MDLTYIIISGLVFMSICVFHSEQSLQCDYYYNHTYLLPPDEVVLDFEICNCAHLFYTPIPDNFPSQLSGDALGPSSLNLKWVAPKAISAYLNYTVEVKSFGQSKPINTQKVKGGTTNVIVEDLDAFWRYSFCVFAVTYRACVQSCSKNWLRTKPAEPGRIHLNVKSHANSLLHLEWSFPGHEERGEISYFNLSIQAGKGAIRYSKESGRDKHIKTTPERKYTFTIYAVNKQGQKGNISTFQYFSVPDPPPSRNRTDIPAVVYIDYRKRTIVQVPGAFGITVGLDPSFFTNDTKGHIVDYGLVVYDAKQHGADYYNYKKMANWKQVSSAAHYEPYRATPRNWTLFSGKKKGNFKQFEIGADGECRNAKSTDFCNGKLKHDEEYYVQGFTCTLGGCGNTPFYGPFSGTEELKMKIAVAVVSLIFTAVSSR